MKRGIYVRAAMLVALTGVVLGAVACSGGSDGANPDDPAHRAKGVEGVPDGSPWVDQDSLQFRPTELTVPLGETVYFKNSETALHTVTIAGKNESGNMKKDIVFKWDPPAAGEYKVTCDFHPQMKATVTVQ